MECVGARDSAGALRKSGGTGARNPTKGRERQHRALWTRMFSLSAGQEHGRSLRAGASLESGSNATELAERLSEARHR